MLSINNLPDEMITEIYKFCDEKSGRNLAKINRRMYGIFNEPALKEKFNNYVVRQNNVELRLSRSVTKPNMIPLYGEITYCIRAFKDDSFEDVVKLFDNGASSKIIINAIKSNTPSTLKVIGDEEINNDCRPAL